MILIGPDKSLLSTQAYLLQDMLLVIGVSFAHRLTGQLAASDNVTAKGRPDATLKNESFRRWAIACAHDAQPTAVMLIIGGNDVASRDFQFPAAVAARTLCLFPPIVFARPAGIRQQP